MNTRGSVQQTTRTKWRTWRTRCGGSGGGALGDVLVVVLVAGRADAKGLAEFRREEPGVDVVRVGPVEVEQGVRSM